MLSSVAIQQSPCALLGSQLRGSRCGLRAVALAAPRRVAFRQASFAGPKGTKVKKDSTVASAPDAGETAVVRRRPG